jgi:hypothetical protein
MPGWALSTSSLPTISQAQITLDGSLSSRGALWGPNYTIYDSVGQIRGPNLFHSFGAGNVRLPPLVPVPVLGVPTLGAPGGQIHLVSVASAGEVGMNPADPTAPLQVRIWAGLLSSMHSSTPVASVVAPW